MKHYRADFHIHTVLSPCASLDMSPINIINKAKEKKIDIIGITDHNSTKQCRITKEIGEKNGIYVVCGAEITTKEEIHCLTFFEDLSRLDDFQKFIDEIQPNIKNDVQRFGYQLIVDEAENVLEEEDISLFSALNVSIDELADVVHNLGGLFIPAHIDRQRFSLISQLGFVPFDIDADAFEISKNTSREKMIEQFPYLEKFSFINNSDSHFLDTVGETFNLLQLEEINFKSISYALKKLNN
jgi:hypothetical protein